LRWVQISCDFADSLNDLFGREGFAEFKALFPTAPDVPEKVRKGKTQAVAFQVERHEVACFRIERKGLSPAAGACIAITPFVKNASPHEIAKCVTHACRVQSCGFNDLDPSEVVAPVKQAQDLTKPLVGNLDRWLGYGRWLAGGRHFSVMVTWPQLTVKICVTNVLPGFAICYVG
jgi:hypothetical protein